MIIKRPHRHTLTQLHKLLSRSLSSSFSSLNDNTQKNVQAHSFTEALIEALYEPIIILDNSLTIIAANKAFFKTFKLRRKTVIQQNISSVINTKPQIKTFITKLKLLKQNKAQIKSFELTYNFEGVGERTLTINAKRIEFGKYTTDLILITLEDITKQKKLEQQKDDFVGYVTHELKTPITTVYAFIQILQGYHKKTQDKKSQFLLAKVMGQMERLTNLLNSFTNVYKAQTGKLVITKKQLNMNEIIHDVLETFQYMTSSHTFIVEGKISHMVRGDGEKIREVLINLITNAIKYSPNAHKINILLEETPKEIIVRVKDYGVGLSLEDKEKIFERFYRVKIKRDNRIEGLGLGLYLTAAIIKAHHGQIWVESKENKGSLFSFSLPLQKNAKLAISANT